MLFFDWKGKRVLEGIMKLQCLFLAISLVSPAYGQTIAERSQIDTPSPKTKLEAFTGASGAVIIKEYTETGIIRSGGTVRVSAMTLRNAGSGAESKGLLLSVKEGGTYTSRETNAYVDYDEITGLLNGIDYISAADASMAKLAFFEATYQTRGDLRIIVFNNAAGRNSVSVDVGRIGTNAFLKSEELSTLRQLIVAAKNILDNPDSVAAKGDRVQRPASPTPSSASNSPVSASVPTPRPAKK